MSQPFEHLSFDERVNQAQDLLRLARADLKHNERLLARRHAEQAAQLAPHLEDPWLILAALASPKASVAYLQRALEINPASGRAQKGMQWALQRLEQEQIIPVVPAAPQSEPPAPQIPVVPGAVQPLRKRTITSHRTARRKRRVVVPVIFIYAFAILCLSITLFALSLAPYYPGLIAGLPPEMLVQIPILSTAAAYSFGPTETAETASQPIEELAGLVVPGAEDLQTPEPGLEPSASPTSPPIDPPTATPSQTPTAIPTELPTATTQPTDTPLPTETPTLEPTIPPTPTLAPPTPEPVVQPTKKPKKKKAAAANPGFRPEGVSLNDRWIDVDLSSQRTYAMQGDQVVNSFVVSTGRWPTVTVTGVYKIYVKYRQANMSGDDYFLPNVPNVMYFFKGYGLHGTYWHNNFGTPMSHGCVNLSPNDSAWLFDFASVGTIVSVHQ